MSQRMSITWRIDDLGHTFFTAALAKEDASGRCVGKHVATDRFASICTSEERTGPRIRLDLVDDNDGDVELLRHLGKFSEMLTQLALALVQLASAMVVVAEVRHDAVDDEETECSRSERLGKTAQHLVLVFAVLRAGVEDVLVGGLWVD
jgi:hypothetical protein